MTMMTQRVSSSNSLQAGEGLTIECEIVKHPLPSDILCGKNKICIKHEGSKDFRRIIESYTAQYQQATSRQEKMDITKEIFDGLQSRRFLKYNEDTDLWESLHPLAVRDKIGHALRFSNRRGASAIRNKVRRNGSAPDLISSFQAARISSENSMNSLAERSLSSRFSTGKLGAFRVGGGGSGRSGSSRMQRPEKTSDMVNATWGPRGGTPAANGMMPKKTLGLNATWAPKGIDSTIREEGHPSLPPNLRNSSCSLSKNTSNKLLAEFRDMAVMNSHVLGNNANTFDSHTLGNHVLGSHVLGTTATSDFGVDEDDFGDLSEMKNGSMSIETSNKLLAEFCDLAMSNSHVLNPTTTTTSDSHDLGTPTLSDALLQEVDEDLLNGDFGQLDGEDGHDLSWMLKAPLMAMEDDGKAHLGNESQNSLTHL